MPAAGTCSCTARALSDTELLPTEGARVEFLSRPGPKGLEAVELRAG